MTWKFVRISRKCGRSNLGVDQLSHQGILLCLIAAPPHFARYLILGSQNYFTRKRYLRSFICVIGKSIGVKRQCYTMTISMIRFSIALSIE